MVGAGFDGIVNYTDFVMLGIWENKLNFLYTISKDHFSKILATKCPLLKKARQFE